MEMAFYIASLIGLIILISISIFLIVLFKRYSSRNSSESIQGLIASSEKSQGELIRTETREMRQELQTSFSVVRTELSESIDRLRSSSSEGQLSFQQSVQDRLDKYSEALTSNSDRMSSVLKDNRQELITTLHSNLEGLQKSFTLVRTELSETIDRLRSSISENQTSFQQAVQDRLDKYSKALVTTSDRISVVLQENRQELVTTLQARLEGIQNATIEASEKQTTALMEVREKISESVANGLKEIQEKNEQRLEQIRHTVDEQLQKTLETRITQSFEMVTKQLLEVQKGLTEMQNLAQDVGGLKRALTNVKVRGIIGEVQLGALLEQFLPAGQFEENVAVKPRSSERVEFAIKLPGAVDGETVWLAIDSKFPIEDYQRLQEAYEVGDKVAWEAMGKAFENRLYQQANDISSKYIDVPNTTDFALLFLPFESLYGEAIRRPGLFQEIQSKYHVVIVGPTTLSAFLNSLQVGFKTLAISKQSGEVWKVLGAVKTEFQRFGDAVTKVQKNLDTASSNLSNVSRRMRQMGKKLGEVSALPKDEAALLLPPEEIIETEGDDSD
jgi:DNA recombination protein RmuC